MDTKTVLSQVVELSHWLGEEPRELAIMGEGNTSALSEDGSFFYVKASGTRLMDIPEDGFVKVDLAKALDFLKNGDDSDTATQQALKDCRVEATEKRMPSVETFLHAYLLSLPKIKFVGHTHATYVNMLTCCVDAEKLIAGRLFPDEIVCCGVAPLWVPYTDPGLPLARELAARCEQYIQKYNTAPRVILMQNHGMICLADSVSGVQSATAMYQKTAKVILGAVSMGGVRFMSEENVNRIVVRPDEAYRKQVITGK